MSLRSRIVRSRIRKHAHIGLEQLDALLDVPVTRWDRNLSRLVAEFRDAEATLDVPPSTVLADGTLGNVTWAGLFEAQVRQLPRMERAEEFRMARRYEFVKARVRAALIAAGHAEERVDELVLRPMHALPAPTGKSLAAARARASETHLARCIDELEQLRNLYVEGALYLVFGPVRRYRDLGVDQWDLIQEGSASLFQAIDGFDWRREVRFKTYAVFWIQQAILKTLYNASRTVRIPIWVQKAHRKIRRAQDALRAELGGEPPVELLAERVQLPVARVEEILAVRRFAVSIDAPISTADDASSLSQMLPDESLSPIHETVREGDLGTELREAMAELPERERLILVRRFGLGGADPETLAEIAVDLGVTAERVRQLQKSAIDRLQRPAAMQRLSIFG